MTRQEPSRRLRVLLATAGVLAVVVAVRYAILHTGGKPNARQEVQSRERSIMMQLDRAAEEEDGSGPDPAAGAGDPESQDGPEQRP